MQLFRKPVLLSVKEMISKKEEITNFALEIEKIVEDKQLSYIDAILHFCEKTGMEIELIGLLVSGTLKSKIEIEAEELHFLPKSTTNKLPV